MQILRLPFTLSGSLGMTSLGIVASTVSKGRSDGYSQFVCEVSSKSRSLRCVRRNPRRTSVGMTIRWVELLQLTAGSQILVGLVRRTTGL